MSQKQHGRTGKRAEAAKPRLQERNPGTDRLERRPAEMLNAILDLRTHPGVRRGLSVKLLEMARENPDDAQLVKGTFRIAEAAVMHGEDDRIVSGNCVQALLCMQSKSIHILAGLMRNGTREESITGVRAMNMMVAASDDETIAGRIGDILEVHQEAYESKKKGIVH
ncbi:MAG: hypothetical protein ABIH29_02535 [Candidatus Micrarchaeota archaeon]